jgi:hypothetical protein
MPFREIIAVYSENHKPKNTFCGQNTVLLKIKAGGKHGKDSYHCA